jgi:Recombination endonuclease VII
VICEKPTRAYPQGRTGTDAGYTAHRRAGEVPCRPCMEGTNARRNRGERTSDRRTKWRQAAIARDPHYDRRQNLKAKFGISLEDYDRLLAEQGGRCAICPATEPGGRHKTFFPVDHDHACCSGKRSCGKCLRGLLCAGCNFGLGHFGDDPERLLAAAAYLLDHRRLPTSMGT